MGRLRGARLGLPALARARPDRDGPGGLAATEFGPDGFLPADPAVMAEFLATPPTTCFSATKLNGSTFVIVEDDKWDESPYIYAKLFPSSLVLIDTGCGGAAKDPTVELRSLRKFIETYPVADNGGQPLNENGKRKYVVICTHCHYDHIGKRSSAT